MTRTCFRCGAAVPSNGQRRVCDGCRAPKRKGGKRSTSRILTFRERQIIDLVTLAMPNKLIGHELILTVGTVKVYLDRIFRKLGVTNRTELAMWRTKQSDPYQAEASGEASLPAPSAL